METFLHAVASVTIILLLTATGYFCAVKGWMTVQVKTFISRYLMTVGIPVMLIYGMQNNLTRADVLAAPRLLLIPLLVIPSCVVMSLLAGRLMRLPHRQLGVFVMMAAMGNTIFIGLAMCLELFGDVATPYVMLFYLVSSCFTQLIGIPLVRWSGEAGGFSMQMVWKFLRAPTVISVFLSLLLVGLDIHLPSLVMSYAKYINNTVTPLALLLTGCGHAAPETTAPTLPETQAAATQPTQTSQPETLPTETQPTEEHFLLTFAGDCTFGSNPTNYYAESGFIKTVGDDYAYPFANVIDYFAGDEFSMVNLEGPLCDEGNPMQKKHVFHGPTAYVNCLTENSIEAVTVANNHSMDYGANGYASTLAVLEQAGVPYVERDSTAVVTTGSGLTIGLYAAVYYKLDVADMTAKIAALREQGVDLIIFAPHWGVEGTYHPTEEQKQVGHAAIDAGADIVFGSHPHVLQPIEEYGGGIIFYSLGNFSFGGNGAPKDHDTALVQQEVIRDAEGTVRLGQLTIVPASVSSVAGRNNFQRPPTSRGRKNTIASFPSWMKPFPARI